MANLPVDVIDQVNYAFANIKNGLPILGDQWADLALSKSHLTQDWTGDRSDRFSKAILKELSTNSSTSTSLPASTTTSLLKLSSSSESSTITSSVTSSRSREDKLEAMRGNFGELYQLKKRRPHLKTNLSIGGWTWSSNFLPAANSTNSIKKFVKGVKELLDEYGFDGVDLDWEYPKGPLENAAFLNMTRELREVLGPNRTLSIAVACGDAKLDLLIGELAKVVDHFNLMSYDFTIAGLDSLTYHHSNLFSSPQIPDKLSTNSCVRYYQEQGAEPGQIILGIPFYGRSFRNASSLGSTYDGPGKGSYEPGFIDYRDINCVDEKFDEDTKGAYCVQTQKATKTMTRTITQTFTQISAVSESMTVSRSQSSSPITSLPQKSDESTQSAGGFFTTLTISLRTSEISSNIVSGQTDSVVGTDSTSPVTNTIIQAAILEIVAPQLSTIISTKLIAETFTVEEEVPCLIVYDSKRSIVEKLKYIKKLGLGGIMFWESAGDNGDLIDAIKEHKLLG